MSNVTPIKPPSVPQKLSACDICEIVIRAKQIVRAVRVAEDHEAGGEYAYALEQVEDMLEEAGEALGLLTDVERREDPS